MYVVAFLSIIFVAGLDTSLVYVNYKCYLSVEGGDTKLCDNFTAEDKIWDILNLIF
jgi:hypothetical protein